MYKVDLPPEKVRIPQHPDGVQGKALPHGRGIPRRL